eukprot:scaffold3038_cov250-Pinguiococcus_pyrenoidosus.AAC.2
MLGGAEGKEEAPASASASTRDERGREREEDKGRGRGQRSELLRRTLTALRRARRRWSSPSCAAGALHPWPSALSV